MRKGHALRMLMGCGIALAGIAAIALLQVPTTSVVLVALVLICPLLHLTMMGGEGHDHAPARQPREARRK